MTTKEYKPISEPVPMSSEEQARMNTIMDSIINQTNQIITAMCPTMGKGNIWEFGEAFEQLVANHGITLDQYQNEVNKRKLKYNR